MVTYATSPTVPDLALPVDGVKNERRSLVRAWPGTVQDNHDAWAVSLPNRTQKREGAAAYVGCALYTTPPRAFCH